MGKSEPILRPEVLAFVELKAEGYSVAQIAEKMERSRATVSKHIKGYKDHGEKWFTEIMYHKG